MHQEDDRSVVGHVVPVTAVGDPVHLQDVAIGGLHVVHFDRVVVFLD